MELKFMRLYDFFRFILSATQSKTRHYKQKILATKTSQKQITESNANNIIKQSSNNQIDNFKNNIILGFDDYLNNLHIVDIVLDLEAQKQKKRVASEVGEWKIQNITKSTKKEKVLNFIVVDLETTGISLQNNIVEVCAIKFENFQPVSCFTTLVNPGREIPQEATKVNNITNEMVASAPYFHQISKQLIDYVGDLPIVGHNAAFDLKHLFVNHVDFSNNKIFDTLELAKKQLKKYDAYKANWCADHDKDYFNWDVESHKLDTLCQYYGLFRSESHRATSDCMATAFIFGELCDNKIDGFDRSFCSRALSDIEVKTI